MRSRQTASSASSSPPPAAAAAAAAAAAPRASSSSSSRPCPRPAPRSRLLPLLPLLLLLAVAAYAPRPALGGIGLLNSCPYALTVYARSGAEPTFSYNLSTGGKQWLDFGPDNVWPAGVIWASKTGNNNNSQVTQVEFTIGGDIGGGKLQDFYDISLVNAYNQAVNVTPINPPSVGGAWCGSPACVFPESLSTFCTAPNTLAGADPACINTDGPGLVATAGTQAFKAQCPQAYSYSKDDITSTYSCAWGTNYEVTFCP